MLEEVNLVRNVVRVRWMGTLTWSSGLLIIREEGEGIKGGLRLIAFPQMSQLTERERERALIKRYSRAPTHLHS